MNERGVQDFAPGQLTCQQLAELVSDHIEGVLAASLQRRVTEHLAGCADCTTYVEQMRTTIVVTRSLASKDVAPPVRSALLELFRAWATQRPR